MHIAPLLLGAALVALCVAAVVVTRMTLRRSGHSDGNTRTLARWSRTTAATAGLVAIVLTQPGVSTRIESASGVDNLAMLLSHLFGIVSLLAIRVLLVPWTYPPENWTSALRFRFAVAGAVAAAVVIIFAVANSADVAFTNSYAADGGVAAYLLITDAYWALVGAFIAWDCAPPAIGNIRTGHRMLGTSQALIAVGGVACAVWGATEGVFAAIAQAAGGAWSVDLQDMISSCSAGLFALSLFSGITVGSMPGTVARRRTAATRRGGSAAVRAGRATTAPRGRA
ncbi:hypothetical protein [Kitasatospora sp. NPDC058478]|uniref:hypothetical protein n=1 Tax=unclassified Kitasatospora TaxID=2633591 RepID=UPI003666A845